jgi:hypothetical protein
MRVRANSWLLANWNLPQSSFLFNELVGGYCIDCCFCIRNGFIYFLKTCLIMGVISPLSSRDRVLVQVNLSWLRLLIVLRSLCFQLLRLQTRTFQHFDAHVLMLLNSISCKFSMTRLALNPRSFYDWILNSCILIVWLAINWSFINMFGLLRN